MRNKCTKRVGLLFNQIGVYILVDKGLVNRSNGFLKLYHMCKWSFMMLIKNFRFRLIMLNVFDNDPSTSSTIQKKNLAFLSTKQGQCKAMFNDMYVQWTTKFGASTMHADQDPQQYCQNCPSNFLQILAIQCYSTATS
jgi:hypothetical protein